MRINMVLGKVVAYLCLALIITKLKFSVKHDRVVTTLNIIFSVVKVKHIKDACYKKLVWAIKSTLHVDEICNVCISTWILTFETTIFVINTWLTRQDIHNWMTSLNLHQLQHPWLYSQGPHE
jgi:hypothetical protein